MVNVVDCKMFWQNMGDYLCVRVERYKKTNVVKEDDKEVTRYSGLYYNFEFFRLREKQIPVDSVEVKESCYAFAWEPFGQKFVIVSGESVNRTSAAFYRITSATTNAAGKLEMMKEFKNRSFLQCSWSPQGNYCALASTASKQQSVTPHVEFFDASSVNDVQFLTKIEHEHMTDFEWDPTGRYFVTYVSFWNYRLENSYMLWNFQGRPVQPNHKMPFEKLFKFSWRPRPPSLLSAEQIKEIRKNLKPYSEKFNAADRVYQMTVSKELLDKRKRMMDDFVMFRRAASKRAAELRAKKIELRAGIDTDTLGNTYDREEIEYSVQFLVETKKEEIAD